MKSSKTKRNSENWFGGIVMDNLKQVLRNYMILCLYSASFRCEICCLEKLFMFTHQVTHLSNMVHSNTLSLECAWFM